MTHVQLVQARMREIERNLAFGLTRFGRRRKVESFDPSLENSAANAIHAIQELRYSMSTLFEEKQETSKKSLWRRKEQRS